jgi:ribose 5-phosphate isomerase A
VSKSKTLSADEMKKAAAHAVLPKIQTGMKLGLGTGSTANHFITGLAEKVKKEKLDILCVPTSAPTAKLAKESGLTLTTLEDHPFLDMTVDGVDEIDPQFRLIKGGGGALLFEKIVASSSRFVVTIADESKQVKKLGKFPLPIEVVPFGVKATGWKLERAFKMVGLEPKMTLRAKDGKALRTEAGNVIIDCACGELKEEDRLELILNNIPGVVNCGLFIGISGIAYIARSNGKVEELTRA